MFTGIIEHVGRVVSVERLGQGRRLVISSHVVTNDLSIGDSVAVNGCCLTVTSIATPEFVLDVVEETVRKTTLATLASGGLVNLERAMPATGRFGGHVVQGHVDCVSRVLAMETLPASRLLELALEPIHAGNVVEVGSIAIDGVSLTVARKKAASIVISVIPHTLQVTTLGAFRPGTIVNLEFDILGKYVQEALKHQNAQDAVGDISEKLAGWGY